MERAVYLPDFIPSWSAATVVSSNSNGGMFAVPGGVALSFREAEQPHAPILPTAIEAAIKDLRFIVLWFQT